jgi:hypothetical protein
VDVVPASFAWADDGDVLAGEDQFGEFVDLAAAGVEGAAAVAWYCMSAKCFNEVAIMVGNI